VKWAISALVIISILLISGCGGTAPSSGQGLESSDIDHINQVEMDAKAFFYR